MTYLDHTIDQFPAAVATVTPGVLLTELAQVNNEIAPAVFTCGGCACLFWPDRVDGGFMVDRYLHTGGMRLGECSGGACACHNLPDALRWTGEVWEPWEL